MKNLKLPIRFRLPLTTGMLLMVIIVSSCKKPQTNTLPTNTFPTANIKNSKIINYATNDEPTVLGIQYGNPYLTSTMKAAKTILDTKGFHALNPFEIRTTHLYIKFSPKTQSEYDLLTSDTAIELYDCPMDYQKLIVGNWYQDPEISDSLPTPQYAAIPVNYKFNREIEYQILANLYLPEQDKQARGESFVENADYLSQLLIEAFNLTNNPPPMPENNWHLNDPDGGDYSGGYAFPGKIQIFDTRLNRYIPLSGVKITARISMFTTYSGITDGNGDYFLNGTVAGTADYAIKFQRAGFSIKKDRLRNAYISRVNQPNHWSYGIEGGMDRMWGHMFRAAFRYYYGDIAGLPRPGHQSWPLNSPINFEINMGIIGRNTSDAEYCTGGQGVNYIALPYLVVARNKEDGTEFQSDEIYSTTIHEIAHTSHYNTMNRNFTAFIQVNNIIKESFAVGVEWLLTGMEYKSLGIPTYGDWNYHTSPETNFPNDQGYQWWTSTNDDKYTSLFINLIDDVNDASIFFGRPVDNVSGYTLANIQSMLPNIYGINSLRTQLKANKPTRVSDIQIDQLLNFY